MIDKSIICFISAIIVFVLGTWFWLKARETSEGEMVRYGEDVALSREYSYERAVIYWLFGLFLVFLGWIALIS